MNRAERRKAGIKNFEPMVTIKVSDLERIKRQAAAEALMKVRDTTAKEVENTLLAKAVDMAFVRMLALPMMIIHDKFGQLMKKDGREERFLDLVLDLSDTYNKDLVTIEDLEECLKEEVGIKLEDTKWGRECGKQDLCSKM